MIFDSVTQLVGKTPLLSVNRIQQRYGYQATVVVKLEGFNPGGSAKDRVACFMIEDAERRGLLKPGDTIIEPTSGNTGIGLAMVAAARGYKMILVMPDTMSVERRQLLAAYGAKILLSPGADGMAGAIALAEKTAAEIPGSFIPAQFDNPANPAAHYAATGPEIWEDTQGKVDIFVAGIGTGGTISGTGKYLKEQNPALQVVGFEPLSSPLLTQGTAGAHKIQGIGANFVPANLDRTVCDEILAISDENAYAFTRQLAAEEGILAGISSGAALCAAVQLALRPENSGKLIVALLPDTGERYLSTGVFTE